MDVVNDQHGSHSENRTGDGHDLTVVVFRHRRPRLESWTQGRGARRVGEHAGSRFTERIKRGDDKSVRDNKKNMRRYNDKLPRRLGNVKSIAISGGYGFGRGASVVRSRVANVATRDVTVTYREIRKDAFFIPNININYECMFFIFVLSQCVMQTTTTTTLLLFYFVYVIGVCVRCDLQLVDT